MTRVCNNCVMNPILSEEIKEQGKHGICDHCGKPGETTALKDLAERIHDVLQEHFRLTPGYPEEPVELFLYKEDKWKRRGDPTDFLISDIAGLDEPIAEELVSLLSEKHTYEAAKDGVENPYGSEAMYEEREPSHLGFQIAWNEFRREIQSKSRFFSATAEHVLASIFGDLDSLSTHGEKSVIKEIQPGSQDAYVWRGRTGHSKQEVKAILRSPAEELGPPPSHLAKSGRMNAQGVSVFYGALEQLTCISELRPPVGTSVVIGQFNVIRHVKLLDLGALAEAYVSTSYFCSEFPKHKAQAAFLRYLVSEISRPVIPEEKAFEYLPTQAVAEYLAQKACPRLDGIIFPSSQTEGKGNNVVLFNHARGVEAYDLPPHSSVEISLPSRNASDYEDGVSDLVFVDETVPFNLDGGEPPSSETTKPPRSTALFTEYLLEEPVNEPEPTLRLDVESLILMETTGITYSSSRHSIIRTRETQGATDSALRWSDDLGTVDESYTDDQGERSEKT